MAEAVGILEVFGLATAFVRQEQACKRRQPASTASGMHQIPRKRRRRNRSCGSRNGRSKPENWCSAALRNTKSDRGYGKDAENQRPG